MSRNFDRIVAARQLRRAMTPAEGVLWKQLRNRRFAEFKFRRQHPLGPFYAEMARCESRVIVELDGETHLGREEKDESRSAYLRAQGWVILRYWNNQVYDDLEAVLEDIYRKLHDRKP